MAEVFALDAVLNFRSNVGPALRELSEQFRDLDRIVKSTAETLGSFERVLKDLSGSTRSVRNLATALEQVSRVNFSGLTASEKPLAGIAENLEKIAQTDTAAIRQFTQAMSRLATADLSPAAREVSSVAAALDKAVDAERRLEQTAGQAAQALARQARAAAMPTPAAQGLTTPANVQRQATSTEETAKAARSAAAAMERMAKVDFSRSVSGAEKLAQAMDTTAQAAQRVTNNAQQVAEAWSNAAKNAKDAADAMKSVRTPAGLGGGRGGGGGGGVLPPGERPMGEHDWLLASIAASTVAETATKGVRAAFDPAANVQSMLQLLQTDTRVSAQQAAEAQKVATQLAIRPLSQGGVPGSTIQENLGAIRDLKLITGDLGEALQVLPQFARLASVLNVVHEQRTGTKDPAFAAAKAVEILGKMFEETRNPVTGEEERRLSMPELVKTMDAITRMVMTTNGRVDPQMFLQFAKQGTVAGMKMSDKFLFQDLPLFLQTQGGYRTGTAFQSMLQVFDEGKLTAKSLQALEDIGLAKPGSVKETKQRDPVTGRLRTRELVDSGGIYNLPLMFSDLPAYLEKAQQLMEAKGIHGVEAQIDALGKASQRSTIARFLGEALKDLPVFKREEATNQAQINDPLKFLMDKQVNANLQALNAAFENFKTLMGLPAMKDALAMLQKLTQALNEFADFLTKHPTLGKYLTEVGTAAAAVGTTLAAVTTTVWLTAPALKMFKGLLGEIIGLGAKAATIGLKSAAAPAAEAAAGAAAAGGGAAALVATGALLGGAAGFAGAFKSGKDIAEHAQQGQTPVMVDEFGNAIGYRQASPPPAKPTVSNPTPVFVVNPTTGKDIRDGTSRGMADHLSLPSSQPSWFDQSMVPGMQPNPIGP